jgi:hypothetical protein
MLYYSSIFISQADPSPIKGYILEKRAGDVVPISSQDPIKENLVTQGAR